MTIIERLPLIEDLASESRVSDFTPAGLSKVAGDDSESVDFDPDNFDIERVVWDSEYRETIMRLLNVPLPD